MVTLNFLPANRSISVKRGSTILEAARLAGVLIESPCNGAVVCSKCMVRLGSDSLRHIVRRGVHQLAADEERSGLVLSCEAEVTGDISVEVLDGPGAEELKIISHGHAIDVALAPLISKVYQSEQDRTHVLRGAEIMAVEKGDTSREIFGVVVDIGTTTLVVSLVDLIAGVEVTTASSLNPQSRHAQDVLSRIRIAIDDHGLATMRDGVIDEINRLIREVAVETATRPERIYEVVFSGNTCMLHLAAGVSPSSLGKYPYTPELTGGSSLDARLTGLEINSAGQIYLPPIISAYVGADITAGLLAVRLHEEAGTVLFVDIGTNGEMALVRNGRLVAASTAAGPAFEGMNITFGMRAGEGAIERFKILENGSLRIKAIGNLPPVGICGSGLMDIVAELVEHGLLAPNGKFVKPATIALTALAERLVEREGKPAFLITEGVYLSQRDVRQVQLAKGAIRAGVEFLLRHAGIGAADLDKILIAGSFGFHLTAASLTSIGLLPPETVDRIDFVGNTAKSGGVILLLNRDSRHEMEQLIKEIDVVELANCTGFDRVFVDCLSF